VNDALDAALIAACAAALDESEIASALRLVDLVYADLVVQRGMPRIEKPLSL